MTDVDSAGDSSGGTVLPVWFEGGPLGGGSDAAAEHLQDPQGWGDVRRRGSDTRISRSPLNRTESKQYRFLEVKWIHVASHSPPIRAGNGPNFVELVATFPHHHRTTYLGGALKPP
jgi:hypothetical protein